MRKRILPALLAFVLLFSIVPTAFAKPMTLVLQTIGDTGKEFVYYIEKSDINIYPMVDNVEIIETTYNRCHCGFTVIWVQKNPATIWENHSLRCQSSSSTGKLTLYKITLKDGDSISINTIKTNPTIYFEQQNNYSFSYSTDGENFTPYKNDENIILAETGMAKITFTSSGDYGQPGTLTIRRSDGSSSDYTAPTDSGTSFPDVSKNADYATAVEYVNKLGIMVGDEKGNFNPDKIVSRAEMATIVCRVLGQTANLPKSNVFTDVPTAHWGNECIGKASELNIVNGYGNGKFGPSDPVTYEQAVTMIVRTIGEEAKAISYGGYPDGHLLVAQEKNLLEGIQAAKGQGLARSSVAVLLYNYYTAVPGESHTHSWATRHVDEVGHYEESSGTHKVTYFLCQCGFYINSDNPDWKAIWKEHNNPITGCNGAYEYGTKNVSNDPQYVVDTPAHDETYCTICGATK